MPDQQRRSGAQDKKLTVLSPSVDLIADKGKQFRNILYLIDADQLVFIKTKERFRIALGPKIRRPFQIQMDDIVMIA